MASLIMLTVRWEILNEGSARGFQNTSTMPIAMVAKIKEEAHLWVIASAIVLLGPEVYS
jgi:hypothetical protein